jgi:laminin gamma 1
LHLKIAYYKDNKFVYSAKFLGDQRASYNQDLKFKLRIDQGGPRPAAEDIIILGGGAKTTKITLTLTEQNNPLPETQVCMPSKSEQE